MAQTIVTRVSGTGVVERLPLLLSMVAGMVDLIGFLTLGHVFTAHVTGNLVILAADLARDEDPRVAQIMIVPVFMFAVGASCIIAKTATHRCTSPLRTLLWIQLLLLVCVMAFSIATNPSAHPQGAMAGIAALIAVCAMGCQFALVRTTLPGVPSTASMTVNLADAVLLLLNALWADESLTASARNRLKQSVRVLGGFFAGCVIAGLAVKFLDDGAWALPVGLAAIALIVHDEDVRLP
ncbi:MAG: YoaK family protein [Steroidobacteraceae bacterium]